MPEDFKQIPSPTYDYEVTKLANYYKNAMREIRRELERIDLNDFQRANALATLKSIKEILKELDSNAEEWIKVNIPIAVEDGVIRAIVSLGVVDTVQEAKQIVRFNRLNKDLVKTAVADTQSDLLQISQNVNRKVRNTVREVTAEVLRNNLTQGINGRRALTSDIVRGLREKLGKAVDTGIVDASNRRWEPKVYAETVVRTKMLQSHVEATHNEAVSREALYGIISTHGATDPCRFHEGRIIKLTPNAPGDYPTWEELKATGQIGHPNCRHVISPFKRIDRLPNSIQEKAERQAERGNKAVATGKRNPKDID